MVPTARVTAASPGFEDRSGLGLRAFKRYSRQTKDRILLDTEVLASHFWK